MIVSASSFGQTSIPATWMRGGTSKALFFVADDLPPAGPERDALIKRAMGCPHGLQIDGIGGGRGNTSKIAIVGKSARDDSDVEYTFAQVGIAEDFIDYRATCGNISAAVGPFAIAKGLVEATAPSTRIRIYNSNIDEILFQDVPIGDGDLRIDGDFINAGVPGSGAEIFTDFSRAIGRKTGKMLPTGHPKTQLSLVGGRLVPATLLDVGNPVAYVHARDLDLVGTESPEALLSTPGLLDRIGEIRVAAAEAMGIAGRFSVRVGIVSEPATYRGTDGKMINLGEMDVCARFFALDYCAPNYPGSASVSTGAAARIPGSVVYEVIPAHARHDGEFRIGHPAGVMDMIATTRPSNDGLGFEIEQLGFGRTARALMDGAILVPRGALAAATGEDRHDHFNT